MTIATDTDAIISIRGDIEFIEEAVMKSLSNCVKLASTMTLLTVICPATAFASPSVFFANSCYEKESGDAAGYIVERIGTGDHQSLRLYWSEGAFLPPAEAKITYYDPKTGQIAFIVTKTLAHSTTEETFRFNGVEHEDRLAGRMIAPGRNDQVVLMRQVEHEALNPKDRVGIGYCKPSHLPVKAPT